MTQEEKRLLLVDLCARLPYGVKINVDDIGLFIPRLKYIDGITCHFYECAWTKFIDEIKPYLRPMTSMTEEEDKEFWKIVDNYGSDSNAFDGFELGDDVDWLNAHHFDYRGLIERGLALVAPEGIYK